MSKAALKKELAAFDREQLTQIILDIYDCNKSAKDYLDFFVNPDVSKLRDRFDRALAKELNRSKRGYSKARISVIRRLLKDFQGFQPGSEAVRDAMLHVITASLAAELHVYYPKTMTEGVATIIEQFVDYTYGHGMLDWALCNLDRILAPGSTAITAHMSRFLNDRLNQYLARMGLHRSLGD